MRPVFYVAMPLFLAGLALGMTGVIDSREMLIVGMAALFLVSAASYRPTTRIVIGAVLTLGGAVSVVLASRRGETGWAIVLAGAAVSVSGVAGLVSGIIAVRRRRRTLRLAPGGGLAPQRLGAARAR